MSEFEIVAAEIERIGDENERCILRVRVPADLAYLEGHFEGQPIVPGIAQLLPMIYEPALTVWPDLGPPTMVKRLKFREALRPGHELDVHLTRSPKRLRFEVRRGELVCTTGSLVIG